MKNIKINHPDGEISLQELQKDVDTAISISGQNHHCFTPKTVQSLIYKIIELQKALDKS